MALKDLLQLLQAHRVAVYRVKDLELCFHPPCDTKTAQATQEETHKLVDVPEPENMPPDLRADDLMNAEKVLHWSASPDVNDSSDMPLTGDAPIEPPQVNEHPG